MRLLLLLLLLVPWGVGTAWGVALPPAGVFRYVRWPRLPGRGGDSSRWEETQREKETDSERGAETKREKTE